ncbi:MAG: ATP-binding protein [Lutibacter sp.]|nr:ATP-binding protein [Lutibacter sp.]
MCRYYVIYSANWFDLFSDETIADAFMDRMNHTSHRIELQGDSLRKKR